ncbi:MAG TPA: AAA family ATPase [Thermoanaerobaculia bacterium]
MSKKEIQQATSTELTGGEGFTYEDTVVAYYLAALLREERAAGLSGIVKTVAVQQAGHGHPMDDIIVELDDNGSQRRLSLQAKTKITISAASTNNDFRDILSRAVATRETDAFDVDLDAYCFVVENVAVGPLRTLNRLIDWAKSSPSGEHFARRFALGGGAAADERALRDKLAPLIGVQSPDDERRFYSQFVALNLNGLTEGGILRAELINRLQELVAVNEDGLDLLLFDRLCRIARDAAGTARKWTRQTLLAEFRGAVRLKVAPNYRRDIDILQSFCLAGLADVSDEIAGFRVERPLLEKNIRNRLAEYRLVNLSGLPGCGKSALLKRIATVDATNGPILFLKSDRLTGDSWLTFATALGLQHRIVADLLTEIGATGTPILFIDGIDRVRPDQKGILTDLLRAIEENEHLSNWKVLASSRDQGLEAYRAWFPASFYRGTGIGDVSIGGFSDEEAKALAEEKRNLRRLLFGPMAVTEIARRPFFAAVLARSFPDDSATPQTEVDLISAWWARAGHDAPKETVPQRQRALLDLAKKGVRNLGKNIPARMLKDATFEQVAGLKTDFVIRDHDGGASYSFTHDIFFEWVFFRQLIELGDNWTRGLTDAGEPPLLGRVVGLLAQSAIASQGKWSEGYRDLEGKPLRPQWRREWLTAPPFTPAFVQGHQEFQALLAENDFALLEKLLVWFQAQHTIPSPIILQTATNAVEDLDRVSMADLLGWPSDFESWGRLLDWLLPLAPSLPVRLLPHVLEVFGVWQNVFADLKNPRSTAVIDLCASWLIELESVEYRQDFSLELGRWATLGSEARSSLATALRMMIMRSARSYPAPAIALFERAVTNKRMRGEAYSDLMGFTPTMADVAPEAVVAVAKAELMEELPRDRLEREEREYREYTKRLKRLRAIPEGERTEEQKRALQYVSFPIRHDTIDLDEIGINRFHNYYYPASPLHEPFASLFAKRPEVALGLVRDLINHATQGWHQAQLLNSDRMGTPIPVVLDFPWGRQEFWGDWPVYIWFMDNAPNVLECAFLALSYWAFKQLEGGRPTDEVVRTVVEGNSCYAVLGLALVLALETYDVSETIFPIVTCQRLWHHDIARKAQEPMRDIDLVGSVLGFDALPRLLGGKAEAKKFLDSRQSRKREIRELAMRFALTENENLRQRFKEALARFPDELPYEVEEARSIPGVTVSLREAAESWAGLGDIQNYRKYRAKTEEVMIAYEPPKPLTPAQEKRLEESTTLQQEYSVITWATKSFESNVLVEDISLADALAFAQARDNNTILAVRSNAEAHSAQAMISAVAAVVIRFGSPAGPGYDWAWDVMGRVAAMREPKDTFHGSKIPWHPANHLIIALVHDRRSSSPRKDSVRRLFELTCHPVEGVAQFAFTGLFMDSDEHVRWVAAQLAMDLALYYRVERNSARDDTVALDARMQSLARALERLHQTSDGPLTSVPPAWVKAQEQRRYGRSEDEAGWGDAKPSFNAAFAAKVFRLFPIEAWCQSSLYKPMVAVSLEQLAAWTAERLMPSWLKERHKRRSNTDRPSLIEWNRVLGDLLARAAPFFETEYVRKEFLAPFLTEDEEGLAVLAGFADMTVSRHVLDAPTVPANTFDLLNDCVERVIRDRAFDPNSYQAGQVHEYDLPKLIRALLFVPIEKEAPGATRFANGDWSQISMIMPIVTRLVTAIGWSSYVMQTFLTLCERAGIAYPLDAFATQANSALGSLFKAKGGWAGTRLPARIAATVQRLADANFPLRANQAQALLRVLDALIDLGDRRSAALEQAEAFRGVQML